MSRPYGRENFHYKTKIKSQGTLAPNKSIMTEELSLRPQGIIVQKIVRKAKHVEMIHKIDYEADIHFSYTISRTMEIDPDHGGQYKKVYTLQNT